jgi:hypothetical protein
MDAGRGERPQYKIFVAPFGLTAPSCGRLGECILPPLVLIGSDVDELVIILGR